MANRHPVRMILALAAVIVAPIARAGTLADCGTGKAPAGFDDEECDVCTLTSTWVLTCDLSSLPGPVEAFAVSNYGTTNMNYSIWGTDGGNDSFCCNYNAGLDELILIGVDNTGVGADVGDTFRLWEGSDGLKKTGSPPSGELVATVDAGEGDDDVEGNEADPCNSVPNNYHERFLGGDGWDWLKAGCSDSFLSGGLGSDWLDGDKGDDILRGGGSDINFVGWGDELDGEEGEDALCAMAYDPTTLDCDDRLYLSGGFGDDILWASVWEYPIFLPPVQICWDAGIIDGQDDPGGLDEDRCSPDAAFNTTFDQCEVMTTLTSMPAACEDPWDAF